MKLHTALVLIFCGFFLAKGERDGDFTIRCGRIGDIGNRCNITDNRKIPPYCPPQSVIPNFNKIAVTCGVSASFPSRFVECKVEEFPSEGRRRKGEQTRELLRANTSLSFNVFQKDFFVWDAIVNYESILSEALAIGEAFVRCKTVGLYENRLLCSLFGIGNMTYVTSNISCSLTFSSNREESSGAAIQCGFVDDHASGRHRGNLTLFVRMENTTVSADVLFVAQSNLPPTFVMETVRVNCRIEEENELLICQAYLNEGQLCDPPSCRGREKSGRKDEVEKDGRDILWDLDRTIEFEMESVGLGKFKFACQQAVDFLGFITKCSPKHSDKRLSIDNKLIVDITWFNSSIYLNVFELANEKLDRFLVKGIVVERCQLNKNEEKLKLQCEIQIDKKTKGELSCDAKEIPTEGGGLEYPLECSLNLIRGYTFQGSLLYSSVAQSQVRISLKGELRENDKAGTSYPVTSNCDILDSDRVTVKCSYDFGGVEKICEMFGCTKLPID